MPIGKIEYNDIYINKKEEEFAEEVENKFKQIDVRGMRDDQEIYEAGQIVLDDCINKITNAKAMRVNNKEIQGDKVIETQNLYMDEALASLRESKKHFQERRNKVVEEHNRLGLGCRITTTAENKQLIAGIANIIEKAEEDALKTIRLKCNPMQETKNAVLESSIKTDENGNYIIDNGEIVRQKPMYEMSNDGTLTFTNKCNSLLPKYAFQGLFKKDEIYEIDYAGCKKTSIIERIKRLTGETKLLLTKDPSGNFLLMNSKGEIRENETIIYEGVTLKRDSLKTYEARQEIEQQKKGLGRITADIDSMRDPEFDPQLKDLLKDIPNGLKSKLHNLSVPEYRKFLVATENRLADLLKDARSQGYELAVPECITKLRTSNGCMELHLINEQDEMTKKIWFNDEILGEKLYNLIGGSEGDYKEYLTKRVQAKRGTFEVFEKSNLIDLKAEKGEKCLTSQEIMGIKGGIAKLTQLIDNFRNSGDNAYRLVKMKHFLRDTEYSLGHINPISEDKFIKNVINPFWDDFASGKNINKYETIYEKNNAITIKNPRYEEYYSYTKNIFLGTKEEQDQGIREVGTLGRIFDKTETSFVGDSIAQKLKTKDQDLNKCLDEIDNILSLDPENDLDDKGELKDKTKQAIIDELYTAAGTNNLMDKLIEKCFIPQERASDPEVQKKVNDLAESLKKQQTFIDSLNENTIIKQEREELLQLQAKENKTYEERKRLQTLQYLTEHPDEAREIHEKSLTMMKTGIKYLGIDEILRNSLMPIFVDKGGGAEGANANIYEDIIGFGAFDLNDENAKWMGDMLKEIAITVAIGVVTGGIGATALRGALRCGALCARGARWINLANKIVKIIRVSKTAWKELNTIQKAGKLLYTSSALLLEAPIFNNVSKVIHSGINGTSLDNLDINPISRENIQTAAFLGFMSIGNTVGKGVLKTLGSKIKLNIDWGKGLQALVREGALMTSELGAMIAAEQGINLTFGYDVIDPETGKVHRERSLHVPEDKDWIQMIGMILAFKMVKPRIWEQYEKKLAEGTFKICRSTIENEFLIIGEDGKPVERLNLQQIKDKRDAFSKTDIGHNVYEAQRKINEEHLNDILASNKNKTEQLQELKNRIESQYKNEYGKELQLSDEQVSAILDAYKNKTPLDPKIKNSTLRDFLKQYGFCEDISLNAPKELDINKAEQEITKLKSDPEANSKRIEALGEAIKYTKYLKSQYDTTELQNTIKEKQATLQEKQQKLEKMNKNDPEYKSLQDEINKIEQDLEKSKKEYEEISHFHDTLTNGATKIIEKVTFKEKLILRLKELKLKLKKLIANARGKEEEIKQIETEIAEIEQKLNTTDQDLAEVLNDLYKGLRNIKGLNYDELGALTHSFYEHILKPLQFAFIDSRLTFDSKYVNRDFESERNVSIKGKFESQNKQQIKAQIDKMRIGHYNEIKTLKALNGFIDKFPKGSAERQILENLQKSLEENVPLNDTRLSEADRVVIFLNEVSYMCDYIEAYPTRSAQDVYKLLDMNQNKLIHQHIQDKHYVTGSSHDVLHILRGNMNMAETFMKNMTAQERVLTRQILIDHDMGYTATFNKLLSQIRSNKFFDATKDHPLWSAKYMENNMGWYEENFGPQAYDIMLKAVRGHSSPDTQHLPSGRPTYNGLSEISEQKIFATISTVDCLAASTDYKSAFIFSQPEIAGQFLNVYKEMNQGNIDLAIQQLHKIKQTAQSIQDPSLRKAIDEAFNAFGLHTDPGQKNITLDIDIEHINTMSDANLEAKKAEIIKKLNNKEKSQKTLSMFCKANKLPIGKIDQIINGMTHEQIKNYLKFDYINDKVSFPYEKYLSQYGVRLSEISEGLLVGETNGVVQATFELAGDSFNTLLEIGRYDYNCKGGTVADFALASFVKVCEDMNIDVKRGNEMQTLKTHINERVENHNGKTITEYLKDIYKTNRIEFRGKNNELITLKFDGASYDNFDSFTREMMEINNIIDKQIEIIEGNPNNRRPQICDVQQNLNNLFYILEKSPGVKINEEKRCDFRKKFSLLTANTTSSSDDAITVINKVRECYDYIIQ